MIKQWTFERAFETEREAQAAAHQTATDLIAELASRGFTAFVPVPRPTSFSGTWEEFAKCRLLVAWIPDWAPSENRGKFVARADTLVDEPEGP